MAKYSSTIEYKISTSLDKSGIAQLQAEIRKTEAELQRLAGADLIGVPSAERAKKELMELRALINSSFNSRLGMLDSRKLIDGLEKSNKSLRTLQSSFALAGSTGEKTFVSLLGRLGTIDTGIQSVSRTTEKMFNTIGNTVRWGIVASGFQQVLNSVHQTVQYVRDLDESLTNIMMVTGYNRDQMNEYAKSANEAAKALSSTTVAMTDATLVFAQQGFDVETSQQLAQRSTQLANISQQDTATTSDQITTMMNAYNFSGNLAEIDRAMDSWAEVANVSAADVEEIATASQKAASTAYTVGLTMDQLNAQIATIESVTREAPENIGNALKTIYSRFADISLGETLDDGVDLGQIAQTLGKVGVDVLDEAGQMRNVGNIMEDLMVIWDTMSQTDQSAISTVIAGRYQLSRFQALMNRSDLYSEYLDASLNAEGTADEMQKTFEESMQGRLNKLQASAESIFSQFFDTDDFYSMIDALTQALDLMNQFIESIGGGSAALTAFGAIATRVFSQNIGTALNNFISNRATNIQKANSQKAAQEMLTRLGGTSFDFGREKDTIDIISNGLQRQDKMSAEQQEQYKTSLAGIVELKKEQYDLEEKIRTSVYATNTVAEQYMKAIGVRSDSELLKIQQDEDGNFSVDTAQWAKVASSTDLDKRVLQDFIKEANPDQVKALRSAFTDLNNAGDGVAAQIRNITSSLDKLIGGDATAFGRSVQNVNALEERINSLTEAFGKDSQEAKKVIELYKELQTVLGTTMRDSSGQMRNEDYSKAIAIATKIGHIGVSARDANLDNIIGASDVSKHGDILAGLQERLLSEKNVLSGLFETVDTGTQITHLVRTTAAIGDLAFAVQSFQSIGDIWENQETDEGEKILSTVANLGMTLPMVTTGLMDAAAAAKAFSAAIGTGPLLAIVAALGLVAAGGKALYDLWTADARAAEDARKSANNLANAYQDLQTKQETFNTSVDNYKNAKQSLSELTQGTEEWNSKLKETNNTVLELLDTYPELAQYVTRDSNGVLQISEAGLVEFSEDYSQRVSEAEIASQFADIVATQKEIASDQTDLMRSVYTVDPAMTGASVMTLEETHLSEGQLEKLYNLAETEGEFALSNAQQVADAIGVKTSDPIVSAITQNSDKIVDNYTSVSERRQAAEIQQQELAASVLRQQEGYDLSGELESQVASVVGELSNVDSSLYQGIDQKLDNESLQTIANDYADQMGYAKATFDSLSNTAKFYDENGEVVAEDVGRDQMQMMLASAEAMQEAASMWQTIADQLNSIGDSTLSNILGENSSDLVTSWRAGGNLDVSSMSGREQKEVSNILAQGDFSVEDLFGDMSTEEVNALVAEFGFESGESFAASFSNGMREALSRENAFDEYMASLRDNEDAVIVGQATVDELDRDTTTTEYQEQAEQILALADNVYDLEYAYREGRLIVGDFNEGLIQMGSNYADLTDETNKLQKAQKRYEDVLDDSASTEEELVDAQLEMLSAQSELEDALKTKEWSNAREELQSYIDTLENADKSSEEYQNATVKVADTLSDLTGLEVDAQWVDENRQAVNDWLNGLEGAGAKLDALLTIDNADEAFRQTLSSIGVEYGRLKDAIANNSISFSMTGYADFDQVNAALGIIADKSHATSEELDLLAAYLNAMGGASLVLERNGETMEIPAPPDAPDTSGSLADTVVGMAAYTAQLAAWKTKVTAALEQGWSFRGIDLPDSSRNIPTSSPSGGGSSGGSGGGSGGGGGGGSSYEPKTKDPIEEEIDRYERVNTLLEDAENRYDRLNSDRERLTGFDMADDMEEEIKLLNRQIELHKEKLEIQKEEAQELRDELSRDYGITFDQEGFITNYATTHQRLIDEVNRLIDQYNATTSESGQEALEEQIEDAQDALDKFNETYQRYDELWAGDLQETLNTLEDIEDQIEDIRIEAFNTQVEAADNLQDIQETLNEFNNTLSHFGEDTGLRDAELAVENLKMGFDIANESAEQLYDTLIARGKERLQSGLLTDEQRRAIEQDIQMYENAKKQIGAGSIEAGGTGMLDMSMNNMRIILEQIRQYENTGTSTIFGEASSELYDAAQDVFDQATDDIQDLEGWVNDLRDAILDMIDEVAEAIEERQEQYEAITDELEHQRDIIELIHGDEAYAQINEVLAAQQNNYQTSIKEMTQTLDYWKDLLGSMEEGSEEWKAINEQIVETQEALNDLVQESLENLQEQYENTVNNITNQWVESALGTDLDWMSEQWELINRNADYYLDDVNAAYETQKLQNKYLELLDGSNDLHIQQMITEQMKQQLGYLRDKEKISEYDVAYANAQLEILQKRIALEEAQRNKSQMQLRRDSQGNYRYVYTADEDDVNAAEGDLLDAQNNAYNLSKEQMKQTQDDSLSALQDAQQLLNDIWTNANLSLEEKKNRTQTIIDSLKEYLAGTSEQLGESEKNIINDFIGMVEIMTDENNERLQGVYEQIINGNLDAFDQIDTRWSTSLTEWLQNMEDFNISTDGMFENLIDNANDYQEEIDVVGDLVETDFNDMSDSIQNTIDKTNELASSTSDFINQLKNDAGTIKEYEGTLQSYADKISDVTNEMKAYKDQVTELGQQLEAKEQENANLTSQIENLQNENEQLKAQQNGGSGGGGGGSFGGSGYSESDLAWGIAQNIWTYGISGGWGNDPTRSGKLTGAYGSSFARKVQDIINKNAWSGNLVNYDSSKFSSYSLLGYDTGGYTGEWSDKTNEAKNGKLAYLHQKELVLNAADTENILKAVDMVRQMTQALKSSAISGTISDMVNGKFKMTDSGEKIEQEVHITAEFPNANSASEIEAALLSLNERAVQYSFRRN